MEIQVSKLRDTLKLLQPVVPRKAAIEALKDVLLSNGKAMATDYETVVSVDLPEAVEPILAPVRMALDFLEYIPGYQVAHIKVIGKEGVDHEKVDIVVGSTEATWVTEQAEDFPSINPGEFQYDAVLNGEALVNALATVSDCAATDDQRVVLNAICVTTGEDIDVVAGDGYQLACARVAGKLPGEKPLIIPIRGVNLLYRLWKKAAAPDLDGVETVAQLAMATRPIRLEWNDKFLQLRFGTVTMLIQLVQGTYPSYKELIPTDFASNVTFFAEDMIHALGQVSVISRDASGITRLEWEGETLKVSAKAELVGKSAVTLKARCTSPGKIAFNNKYLQGYVYQLQGEVTISTTSPSGPAMFSHRKSMRVVMPMFVNWDGDGKEQKVGDSRFIGVEDSRNGDEAPAGESTIVPSDVTTNVPFDEPTDIPADMEDDVTNYGTDDQPVEDSRNGEEYKPKKRRGRKAKVKA